MRLGFRGRVGPTIFEFRNNKKQPETRPAGAQASAWELCSTLGGAIEEGSNGVISLVTGLAFELFVKKNYGSGYRK